MKSMSMSAIWLISLAWTLFPMPPPGPGAFAQQAPTETQLDPTGIEPLKNTALREAESGETDKAIRDYETILAAQPDWREGQWNLGMLEYQSGRYAQSGAAFQKVIAFAPQMGVAWGILGLSEFETRDYNDSLTHLEKARTLGMKDDAGIERVALYHLALLLIRQSKFERANELLEANFGGDLMSPQVRTAMGLATLRVPLLPDQVDPSQEALISAAGSVASRGAESVSGFPALLRTYPDVPYLHYAYGLALAGAGRDSEAIGMFREETTLSPSSSLPWLAMSRSLLRSGKTAEAQAATQKAAALDGKSGEDATPEQRIVLRYGIPRTGDATAPKPDTETCGGAMREYAAGQYAATIPDLKACLQASPANGTGWAVLGLSEFALGDYDNALIHLDRGAQLGLSGSPESLRLARYTFGILLVRAGEFDRGTEILLAAGEAAPGDALFKEKLEYALGLALLRRPELPQPADSQPAAVILAAGKIRELLSNSEYDQALAQFKALLKQYPDLPFLHYAYGTALLAISEFDGAAAQMKLEAALSPASELPWVRLASIALRQHEAAQAAEAARRAVLLAPSSAEAHYLLGRALLESGDDAAALPELLAAGRISPGSPEVHFNLAKAYARAKMPEEAQRERKIFAQLNEVAETERQQRSHGVYQGPHDAEEISTPAPGTASSAPK
jgi:predicted Zn-dependent protease